MGDFGTHTQITQMHNREHIHVRRRITIQRHLVTQSFRSRNFYQEKKLSRALRACRAQAAASDPCIAESSTRHEDRSEQSQRAAATLASAMAALGPGRLNIRRRSGNACVPQPSPSRMRMMTLIASPLFGTRLPHDRIFPLPSKGRRCEINRAQRRWLWQMIGRARPYLLAVRCTRRERSSMAGALSGAPSTSARRSMPIWR